MRLTVLGSAGSYPGPGLPASGYLVAAGPARIWVDAGPGTFLALLDVVAPSRLSAVVLSHIHPDHCSDLFALYHYLAYGPGRAAPLPLFAPEGAVERLTGFVGRADRFESVFAVRTAGSGVVASCDGVELRFAAAVHSVPAVATRLDAGTASLVYSGDTGPAPALAELARGCDLLLCEATLQGERDEASSPIHLTASEAGDLAGAAGASRLLLTHVPPGLDPDVSTAEAAARFAGPVDVARPGLSTLVGTAR